MPWFLFTCNVNALSFSWTLSMQCAGFVRFCIRLFYEHFCSLFLRIINPKRKQIKSRKTETNNSHYTSSASILTLVINWQWRNGTKEQANMTKSRNNFAQIFYVDLCFWLLSFVFGGDKKYYHWLDTIPYQILSGQ